MTSEEALLVSCVGHHREETFNNDHLCYFHRLHTISIAYSPSALLLHELAVYYPSEGILLNEQLRFRRRENKVRGDCDVF